MVFGVIDRAYGSMVEPYGHITTLMKWQPSTSVFALKLPPLISAISLLAVCACHNSVPPKASEQSSEPPPVEPRPIMATKPKAAQPPASRPEAMTQPEVVALDGLHSLFAENDSDDILEWYSALCAAREANEDSWNRFVRMVQTNPARAVAILKQTPFFPLIDDLYRLVASVIAAKNYVFARQWAETAAESIKGSIAAGLLSIWGGADPQAAVQWLHNQPLLREDSNCTEALVTAWAAVNPAACATWVYQQPTSDALDTAIQALGQAWGESDPAAAVAHVKEQPASATRDGFAAALAEGWAKCDASSALNWYLSTPMYNEASREQPLYSLFSVLASQDLSEAGHQVDSMSMGNARDAAIRGIIDTVVVEDPKQAILWVECITNAKTRAAVVHSLITELSDRDVNLVKQLENIPIMWKK